MEKQTKMKRLPVDHDTRWKVLITVLFKDFTAFFLPDVYPLVDWKKPVVSLDKELNKLVGDKFKGGYVVSDKLFKVYLKGGGEQLLLIHIEVESSNRPNIDKRMFVYFYRIFDNFGEVVTALAIFASDSLPKNYNRFEYEKLGTKATYEYNTYCLKDVSEEELLASDNPFALAMLAVKYLNLTKKEDELRYDFKRTLFRLAINKRYDHKKINALLKFIRLLLVLPEDLENKFIAEMKDTYLKPEVSEYEKRNAQMWIDGLYEAVYGETVEEFIARLEREKEQAVEQAVEQAAAQAAQKAAQKAAQQAAQQAAQLENVVKNMLTNTDLSVQQIAQILNITEQEVIDIKVKTNGN